MERNSLIRFLADEARTLVLLAEDASLDDARSLLSEAGELVDLAARIAARGANVDDHYDSKTQEAA